jgi:general secretion pathway protein J
VSDCLANRNRNHGFTLLELILAISIFAIVVSMVYGAYNLTFKVIDNSQTHARYGSRARVTLERFTEDLESFHMGSNGFLNGESGTVGEFRADSLSFTSTSHLVFDKNELPVGYATISYSVEEHEETGLLSLYRADVGFRPGVEAGEEKGFLLCDGLREVSLTYFDEKGDEVESWESDQRKTSGNTPIPVMVQLRIGFAGDEAEDEVEDDTIFFSTGIAIPQ